MQAPPLFKSTRRSWKPCAKRS